MRPLRCPRPVRTLLPGLLAGLLVGGLPGLGPAAPAVAAGRWPPPREISYTEWQPGLALDGASVRHRRYDGRQYDVARWVGPWVSPGFGPTQLVASWSARTPGDSWIEVRVRGRAADGTRSSWDVLGRWTSGDRFTRRTSVSGQADDLASVDTDTWQVHADSGLTSYRLDVRVMRRSGAHTRSPVVSTIGAMASRVPSGTVPTSAPGRASRAGIVLDVPRYSQMAHRGHYPAWGGGGEAWCSPTSTSMVLGYYGDLPRPRSYDWIPAGHTDPWVDEAARSTYDAAYQGTGNWPFNAAFAAPLAGHAFVTRLRSLHEAERFIAVGIPLVASISFGAGQLSNAPISSTNGHLVVIRGFTTAGDVVVNDPAAGHRRGVRRTYDRAQFEDAWLARSGGLVYVIRDDAHPLPGGHHSNW
ncbi:C39 family peptidase [Nocardioides panaciterrulae]|uniref:Peptidase C39-like domain-containing protein n=1 Tax=Nocardioides panaciterrulae TaxID=661492 RepID=A0A7Y9E486_9ACTN|nr:hypothetical protein [Nocardioides panaciterrulae]